mgnify:CR=1 FL=1
MLCSYGCGQEAKFSRKNGKYCCSEVVTQCPVIKEKNTNGQLKTFKKDKLICTYCNNKISKRNLFKHEQSCKLNPKNITFCSICGKEKKGKSSKVCSMTCGRIYFKNKYDLVTEYNKEREREDNHYSKICFRFHKKECVICKENIIVAVHHYDKNEKNNHPTNLIPICPTHHSYIHSQYIYLIKECVDDYYFHFLSKWKE